MTEAAAKPKRRPRKRLVEMRSTVNLAGFRAGTRRWVDITDPYIEGLVNGRILVPAED